MENRKWASDYLNKSRFENPSLVDCFSGEGNHNYIFESEGKKYVLRHNLEEQGSNNRLKQEYKILRFLEHESIDFAPQSILYDEENQVHITSFVGGEDAGLEDFSQTQLEIWVENLVTIHSLDFDDYRKFCEKQGFKYNEPETPKQNLQKFGHERFEYAQKNLGEKEIIDWTQEKLREVDKLIEENPNGRVGLSHGDIANNTRVTSNEVYFIDWEFARFSYNPEGALSYVYIHEELGQNLYTNIKKLYEEKSDVKLLEERLERSERATRVGDVVWALKRSAKLKKMDITDWKDYFDLAKDRKKLFQERFEP